MTSFYRDSLPLVTLLGLLGKLSFDLTRIHKSTIQNRRSLTHTILEYFETVYNDGIQIPLEPPRGISRFLIGPTKCVRYL